jgi:hypothetical protein
MQRRETMIRLLTIILSLAAATAFGRTAFSQQDNPVLGTWTIVSIDDVRPDIALRPRSQNF